MIGKAVEAITVRYIYSACVVTSTPDVCVLHDPWFTEGIYDGSWYHFPVVEDPVSRIGDVDLIYVSHIHPDHYDSAFLQRYFSRFGGKRVLIANHPKNHLAKKMRVDGIEPTIVDGPLVFGRTSVEIIPHVTGSESDIDSAIVIKYKDSRGRVHCVVNANDIVFDDGMTGRLKAVCGEVDILLCGYTGAGPYPQTYFDKSDPMLPVEAFNKKQEFFNRYKRLVDRIQAKVNIPFAGKYILGGKLSDLNDFRGVADAVEVLDFDEKSVVLSDDGGEIDTHSLRPSKTREVRYHESDIKRRIDELKYKKMDYERLISLDEVHQLPLKRVLMSAAHNAKLRSECEIDYFFCVRIPGDEFAVINANRNSGSTVEFYQSPEDLPSPRSEIYIDPRYLFGLMTHVYHWNNAEVGSQYFTRRIPNVYLRSAQAFLNYLSV